MSETAIAAVFNDTAERHQLKQAEEAAKEAAAESARQEVLEARAQRLEIQANARVESLSDRLQLSESQADHVFQILVKTSRSFDGNIETAGAGGVEMSALPEGVLRTSAAVGARVRGTIAATVPSAEVSNGVEIQAVEAVTDLESAPDLIGEELSSAAQGKLTEIGAIEQVLEPEQLDEYDQLLKEINGFWDHLVIEVVEDIDVLAAEEAAAEATE